MFDWLGDIFSGIGNFIGDIFGGVTSGITTAIFDMMLQWIYEAVYGAVAEFFSLMGNMGTDIFELDWVKATIELFTLFGWALFAAGMVVAVFDVAIE